MIIFFIASSIFWCLDEGEHILFLPCWRLLFISSSRRTVQFTVRDEWKGKEERWGDCKYSLFFCFPPLFLLFETVMFAIDSLLAAAAQVDDTGIWLPVRKKFSSLFLCRSGTESEPEKKFGSFRLGQAESLLPIPLSHFQLRIESSHFWGQRVPSSLLSLSLLSSIHRRCHFVVTTTTSATESNRPCVNIENSESERETMIGTAVCCCENQNRNWESENQNVRNFRLSALFELCFWSC